MKDEFEFRLTNALHLLADDQAGQPTRQHLEQIRDVAHLSVLLRTIAIGLVIMSLMVAMTIIAL